MKDKDVRVIISMMIMCDGILSIDHDGRRSAWLSSALVVMEHGNNRDHRGIASLSSKHTT